MGYPCSKNKSGRIGFKFTFSLTITIIECHLYHKIEKKYGLPFDVQYISSASLVSEKRPKAQITLHQQLSILKDSLAPQCHNFALGIQTCWYRETLKFTLPPTQTLKFALPPTQTPNVSQWNISGVWVPNTKFWCWPCRFNFVCAAFSALATRKLADANAESSGIQA